MSSGDIFAGHAAVLDQLGAAPEAPADAREISAEYSVPYLAHASLEPMAAAARVAKLLTEAKGSTSDRGGVPLDAYMRRDEQDALTDEEQAAAAQEFIFTLPDAPSSIAASSAPIHVEQYAGAWTSSTADAAAASFAAGRHGPAGTGSQGCDASEGGAQAAPPPGVGSRRPGP